MLSRLRRLFLGVILGLVVSVVVVSGVMAGSGERECFSAYGDRVECLKEEPGEEVIHEVSEVDTGVAGNVAVAGGLLVVGSVLLVGSKKINI